MFLIYTILGLVAVVAAQNDNLYIAIPANLLRFGGRPTYVYRHYQDGEHHKSGLYRSGYGGIYGAYGGYGGYGYLLPYYPPPYYPQHGNVQTQTVTQNSNQNVVLGG